MIDLVGISGNTVIVGIVSMVVLLTMIGLVRSLVLVESRIEAHFLVTDLIYEVCTDFPKCSAKRNRMLTMNNIKVLFFFLPAYLLTLLPSPFSSSCPIGLTGLGAESPFLC